METLVSPPQFFFDYCRICAWSDAEIKKTWDEILRKTLNSFIGRINEEISDEMVKKALEKANKSEDEKGVFVRFFANLPEEKQKVFSSEFFNILARNLDNFYETIKQTRTSEQKESLADLLAKKGVEA